MKVEVDAELLQDALEELYVLQGEHDWHKNEPRAGYAKAYRELCDTITKLEAIVNPPPSQSPPHPQS